MDHVNSMPRYAKSFACSGSACPDTCCSGWNVHIDSTTLATWQTITLAKAGPALVHFTRAPKPQDVKMTDHPAVITRKPDGTCPLMTREKLCSVHARHGDEALPLVCHTFPRGLVKSGHEVSLFMSLGCPEAARLALADPTALDMVIAEQLPTGRLPPVGRHDSPGLATPEELADSSVDGVRASAAVFLNAARRLIRDPRLTVWQAWGLYWHKAIETWLALKSAPRTAAAGKLNELRDLADMGQHLLPMARASQSNFVAKVLPMPQRQRKALRYACDLVGLIEKRFDSPVPQAVQHAMALPRALAPYGISVSSSDAEIDAACSVYEQGHRRWFEPFDLANPHLLKNHLLNRLSLRNFPVSGIECFGQELAHEAMDLDVLQVFLVGQALLKQNMFAAQDYVLLVQTFTRHCVPGITADAGLARAAL